MHRHHHRPPWCPHHHHHHHHHRHHGECDPNNVSDNEMLAEYQEMLHYFHKNSAWIDGETGKPKLEYWDGIVDWNQYPYPPQPQHCPTPKHHHHHHHHHENYDYSDYYAYMAWWMWQQWNYIPWWYAQYQEKAPNLPFPEYNF